MLVYLLAMLFDTGGNKDIYISLMFGFIVADIKTQN